MNPVILLVTYCLAILLASLVGGWIPMLLSLTHRRMQIAISLVGGFMLGVAMFHLLTHALYEVPNVTVRGVALWVMAGMLAMFFLERFFCFHHHDAPVIEEIAAEAAAHDHAHDHEALAEASAANVHIHEHGESCDGGAHDHQHVDHHALGWAGATIGLSVHSVISGVALAAAVAAETFVNDGNAGHAHASHGAASSTWIAGMAVFLVIFLHKPFDSMTIGALMARSKSSKAARHMVNGLFAMAIPLGAVLFYLGITTTGANASTVVGYTLAFSAGTFLCISLSDLLPELQFHHHDRVKLSLALLIGIGLAFAISHFEERFAHAGHEHGAVEQVDDHAGHDH